MAVRTGNGKIVKKLLVRGANRSLVDKQGQQATDIAK